MTTPQDEVRRGGREVWAPSKVPPIGVALSDEQLMAIAFRHLADVGIAENMAGHITWQPDGRSDMYVNPWGLWWQELTASDICVVDENARVVSGRWDVTPAIHIHTELHRQRPDARVVVHNHPYNVSLIAALGTLPDLVHQTGALFLDDMYLVEKYDGEIDTPWRAAELAGQVGSANLIILANHGVIAVVGRPVSEYGFEPARFDEMRRGAWDIHERVKDMDLNGVYASLNFPSFLPGFAGQRLQQVTDDRDLAMASVRAWNDWHLEAWAGAYPDRIIPCQLPWLLDPEVGAKMIYENAERGFRAMTFSENPAMLGFPTIHSGYWDPLMAACAETGTVVNLHIGSSGTSPATTDDAPADVPGVLFFAYAITAAVDWLYTGLCTRYPDLKICLSEGGIGWVAGLLDRLDHMLSYHEMYGTWRALGETLTPAEVLKRNFWFCAVEDQSSFIQYERIGPDNILLEADYPHCDSTWPHTQRTIRDQINGLPDDIIRKVTWENASRLYQHPVPPAVQADPNAF